MCIHTVHKHPHKKVIGAYAYEPRGGIVQNITYIVGWERNVERRTNGHSSDSSNMEFMNNVVCEKNDEEQTVI